jgi:hypothetical protein
MVTPKQLLSELLALALDFSFAYALSLQLHRVRNGLDERVRQRKRTEPLHFRDGFIRDQRIRDFATERFRDALETLQRNLSSRLIALEFRNRLPRLVMSRTSPWRSIARAQPGAFPRDCPPLPGQAARSGNPGR